jgi:predicted outer membrane repeat protein
MPREVGAFSMEKGAARCWSCTILFYKMAWLSRPLFVLVALTLAKHAPTQMRIYFPIVTIVTTIIALNLTVHLGGGAIVACGGANVEIYTSTFQSNTAGCLCNTGSAGTDGGAIYAHSGANVEIHDSTFQSNHCTYSGGAIYAQNADVRIYTSTFESNTADGSTGPGGGAICAEAALDVKVLRRKLPREQHCRIFIVICHGLLLRWRCLC